MTSDHRNRTRTRTAAGLTTALLTLLIAGVLHHPGHLMSILLILTTDLSATTASQIFSLAREIRRGTRLELTVPDRLPSA